MKTSPSGIARITVEQAAERLGYGPGGAAGGHVAAPVLLDVRERDEWSAGHAPDAVHHPLTALLEGVPLPPGVQGRRLVVICRSGNRSRQAAALLTDHASEAVDVIGGMHEWARAGLPVVDAQGLRGTVA
ncbi:sulfurtransferase [Streptomyces yokosukanensis]|uniref:Sulfurtransferase n=1 Tax=Streptomyces yokosukanensis TaxID=67386 RepID=A0A101NNQ0_9ACTN|nr:rhodanese-like domain-containing protein [Streptomyces yokosukanensis]KUM96389.1 sulfurtransferase [Streptomyces yokosukanensis]